MEFDDYGTFIGYFDLAQASLYLFWLFFAGLIIYLQRENMREGYPLENDDGTQAGNDGPFPLPNPKTFKLPHGRGTYTVPNNDPVDDRPLAMEQMPMSAGSPFDPTGDPMVDGIGPAAWCMRADEPELDGHAHPKIKPMRLLNDFSVVSWRDCRGLPVQAHDGAVIGHISDLWVDVPEQLVRYLEIELVDEGGKRLAPAQLVKIKSDRVSVHSLYEKHFAGIPVTKSDAQVTKLEEEKICAYWCGGKLYADPERLESQI
ncbi:MAG: photosynthetic reaction center subunit H [Pseudomonadota bacterium]